MSNNLAITQVAANQNNKEVTINNAIGALDAAITESLTVDLTNNATITAVNWRTHTRFVITPAGVAKTLTVQAIKSLRIIENPTANSATIALGSTTFTLAAGESALFYADGTANGLFKYVLAPSSNPFDIPLFVAGTQTDNEKLLILIAVRDFTLPINLTGSQCKAAVAATAAATFTIKKNGASIGSFLFALGGTTATFTFAAAVTFTVGDTFEIFAPATHDATLADVYMNFKGTR